MSTHKSKHIPVGTWIRMRVPDVPNFVGFTYLDFEAGFTVRGDELNGYMLDEPARVALPLTGQDLPWTWESLPAEKIRELGLPPKPTWLADYGQQPEVGTLWGWWREYPTLKERFHPEYPDDLQVTIHDGGPRLTTNARETVWVRLVGGQLAQTTTNKPDVFKGQVLNQPKNLTTVSLRDHILFIIPAKGNEYPILVTQKYLDERADAAGWRIKDCDKCGFNELFDAPSDLMEVLFGNTQNPKAFTTFCPLCGGVQWVMSKEMEQQPKKWWQSWL